MSFLKFLNKTGGGFTGFFMIKIEVGMKGTTEKFLYSIWSGFTHIPTSGILAHGNREADRGSTGSLSVLYLCMMQGFSLFGGWASDPTTAKHWLIPPT